MDGARELIGKLEENAALKECDVARRAHLEDWGHLKATYAPVLIAGPSQIEESAENLRFCLGGLADLCDGWYVAYESSTESSDIKGALKAQLKDRGARSKICLSRTRSRVWLVGYRITGDNRLTGICERLALARRLAVTDRLILMSGNRVDAVVEVGIVLDATEIRGVPLERRLLAVPPSPSRYVDVPLALARVLPRRATR